MEGKSIESKLLKFQLCKQKSFYDDLITKLSKEAEYKQSILNEDIFPEHNTIDESTEVISNIKEEIEANSISYNTKEDFAQLAIVVDKSQKSKKKNHDNSEKDIVRSKDKIDKDHKMSEKSHNETVKEMEKLDKEIEKFHDKKIKEQKKLDKELSKDKKEHDELYEKYYEKIAKESHKVKERLESHLEVKDHHKNDEIISKSNHQVQQEINNLLKQLDEAIRSLAELEANIDFVELLAKQAKEIEKEIKNLKDEQERKNLISKYNHYVSDFEGMLNLLEKGSPMREAVEILISVYEKLAASL